MKRAIGGPGGGRTLEQADAIQQALADGATVLLCREGYAIRCRVEGGRVVYEEIPLEWMTKWGTEQA